MKLRAVIISATLLVLPIAGYPYHFVPNDIEWATWPEFCKARYVTLPLGRAEGFGNRLPKATVDSWRARLAEAYIHVHHYCAGIVYARRAQRELETVKAKRLWEDAIGEATYTFQRTDPRNPLAAEIIAFMANAKYQLGERTAAKDMLKDSIDAGTSSDRPYVLYAMILNEEGKMGEAISLLHLAKSRGITESAELEYLMGLLLFRKDRFDESFRAAKHAYELGYPLPALRDKLIAKGYSFN